MNFPSNKTSAFAHISALKAVNSEFSITTHCLSIVFTLPSIPLIIYEIVYVPTVVLSTLEESSSTDEICSALYEMDDVSMSSPTLIS